MRSDDGLNLVATKFSVGHQHSISRPWLIGNLWWWMEPQDSKDIFTQISTSISFAWAPTHDANVPLNGLFRCRQAMHTMAPQGVDYQTPHPLPPIPPPWGGVGGTCTTPANREKEKARKNLVLVYLIFTFQLFFGPSPSHFSWLGSSHNFFRFPFRSHPLFHLTFFHSSRIPSRLCPLLVCFDFWALRFSGFLYLFFLLSLPLPTSHFPLPLWNFHKVFVLLKMEYILV